MFYNFVLFQASFLFSTTFSGNWTWNTIMIGGGGEIEGLHFSLNGNLYARTDVGGAYIYLWDKEYWLNLFDWLPYSQRNYFSIDSLTSSPHESNILYTANGNNDHSDIFKSSDNGTTWTATNCLNGTLIGGGNQNDRWGGYRLIVHPNPQMSNTIFFGSRQQGLLRNDNAGGNNKWYTVDSFPNIEWNETNSAGIVFVNINPFNYNMYASVVNFGIYMSTDTGKTWTQISDTIVNGLRSIFNDKINDGLFYVTDVKEGLFVYNEKTNKWTNISPSVGGSKACLGIDISPDGKYMLLAGHIYGNSNLFYTQYVSSDVQSDWNWIQLTGDNYDNRQNEITWMPYGMFASSPSAFIFNKNDYNNDPSKLSVLLSTIVVWFNKDITQLSIRAYTCNVCIMRFFVNRGNSNSLWYTSMHGFEEVCYLDMVAPPSGDVVFISALADLEGFMHTDLTVYPPERFYLANNTAEGAIDTSGVDFCESNPNIVVRVPGNGYNDQNNVLNTNATITFDQGKTWQNLESHPPYVTTNGYTWPFIGGQIRIAPDNCNHMVWIPLFNTPWVTKDGGKTWVNSTGLTNDITGYLWEWNGGNWHQWDNDRINGNYLYANDYTSIYVSSDGGYTWKHTTNIAWEDGCQPFVKSDYLIEGHVCVALGYNGLYCSNDYGNTFNKLNDINTATLIDWGRQKDDITKNLMYYYGISTNDYNSGIRTQAPYQIDINNNHIRMNTNNSYMIGDTPHQLIGDRRMYGRIYIGSEGRGGFYSTYYE